MDAEETGLAARAAQAGATGALYAPLLAPVAASDGCFVLGRLAQSVDGRIATRNGASRWISGEADVLHTHRLRAIFDAVVVGAGTVAADDPQLTTRAVPGPSPVRVILDASRRLPVHHRVFRSEAQTLVVCAEDVADCPAGDAERIFVPRGADGLDLAALLAALAARGLRRIFVEGGGVTVSRFLAAGLLDRLHLTIAPLLLGSGIPAFVLPEATTPSDGLRVRWTTHRLGDDILLDIPLDRVRPGCCL
jgi:diaminohydroxyphosphoribosylaminopyrimidine deaminase / 5-amino-6-(5-phosphoribosylamino)uracil reductase